MNQTDEPLTHTPDPAEPPTGDLGSSIPATPKPRTEKQKNASRQNGAKSRGPITSLGKQIAARNSLRHGMLAKSLLLEGENLTVFRHFMEHLEATFLPATPFEITLVEAMAIAKWRQMRLAGMEQAAVTHQLRIQSADDATPLPDDAATRAYIAFAAINQQHRTLDLMNRYESRCDRQYHRALNHLLESQRRREDAMAATPTINDVQ